MNLKEGSVGASNRVDLFVSARISDKYNYEGDESTNGNDADSLDHDDDQNPLQIEQDRKSVV